MADAWDALRCCVTGGSSCWGVVVFVPESSSTPRLMALRSTPAMLAMTGASGLSSSFLALWIVPESTPRRWRIPTAASFDVAWSIYGAAWSSACFTLSVLIPVRCKILRIALRSIGFYCLHFPGEIPDGIGKTRDKLCLLGQDILGCFFFF